MALPPIPTSIPDWSRPIAEVALLFMNAEIEIVESIPGDGYDEVTGTYETPPSYDSKWIGKARAQNLANTRGFNVSGEYVGNPTGTRGYTFQIPLPEDGGPSFKVARGWYVRVLDGGKNPLLVDTLFLVDSVLNSSWRATQLIICTVDVEGDPGWSP